MNRLKKHDGQIKISQFLLDVLKGSLLVDSLEKVQDAYSIRCVPQVHGAVADLVKYAEDVVLREINSVSDNPLIIENDVFSGCHFHGMYLAVAMDIVSMALTILAGISERRLNRLLDPKLNNGLPPFLSNGEPGDVGLMLIQYTAAALVADMRSRGLSSTQSIPTSGGQEDFVSMSLGAGLKVSELIEKLSWVVSAELLAAGRALRFRDARQYSYLASRFLSLVEQELDKLPGEAVEGVRNKLYEIYDLLRSHFSE